jgi:hypothetical protein
MRRGRGAKVEGRSTGHSLQSFPKEKGLRGQGLPDLGLESGEATPIRELSFVAKARAMRASLIIGECRIAGQKKKQFPGMMNELFF